MVAMSDLKAVMIALLLVTCGIVLALGFVYAMALLAGACTS